jgi:hypothetical protein
MKRRNSRRKNSLAPSTAGSAVTVTSALWNILSSAGLPMDCLHTLVCGVTVHNKKGSSAPGPMIEALIRNLRRRDRRTLRSGLFNFFVATEDYVMAAKYTPSGGGEDLSELHAAMVFCLSTGKMRTAKRLYGLCMGYYPFGLVGKRLQADLFVRFELASAVARYHAYCGHRSGAVEYWGMMQDSSPLFARMRSDIVSARLVEALLAAQDGLDLLVDKQAAFECGDETLNKGELENAVERLRSVKAELVKLVPPAEQRKFNIEFHPCVKGDAGEEEN